LRVSVDACDSDILDEMPGEMVEHRLVIQPQLVMADQVVHHPRFPLRGVGDACWPLKSVQPAKERQAHSRFASLSELLVNVALLAAKVPEARIEAEPRVFAAGEQAESVGGYLKRLTVAR
jgi:hypothetical protein